jgi:hypothetical protein
MQQLAIARATRLPLADVTDIPLEDQIGRTVAEVVPELWAQLARDIGSISLRAWQDAPLADELLSGFDLREPRGRRDARLDHGRAGRQGRARRPPPARTSDGLVLI